MTARVISLAAQRARRGLAQATVDPNTGMTYDEEAALYARQQADAQATRVRDYAIVGVGTLAGAGAGYAVARKGSPIIGTVVGGIVGLVATTIGLVVYEVKVEHAPLM
jgi:hypothetical protein